MSERICDVLDCISYVHLLQVNGHSDPYVGFCSSMSHFLCFTFLPALEFYFRVEMRKGLSWTNGRC